MTSQIDLQKKTIKSLVISNMYNEDLRLKFLQKERTLGQILDIAKKKEDAVAQSKVMDGESGNSEVRKGESIFQIVKETCTYRTAKMW